MEEIYSIYTKIIELQLVLTKGKNWPIVQFNHDYTIVNCLETNNTQQIDIIFYNPQDQLILNYTGKTLHDTEIVNDKIIFDQSIIITGMWINGVRIDIDILKPYLNFFPKYDIRHIAKCKRENKLLEHKINTTDLYYNGILHFDFQEPFFEFYNEKLFEQFDKANNFRKSYHLGLGDNDKLQKLPNILNLLHK